MRVEKAMRVFRRLDRHAIARQHVEMGRPRKRLDRRLDRVEGRLHQRPLAPAAALARPRKGHVGVVVQRIADRPERLQRGAGIEMDRHVIAGRRQPLRLHDDRVGVLVTEQDIRDFRHAGPRYSCAGCSPN